ncbi:MAG: hypothetical protein HQM13_00535 [SAR324 cluster bacterium]|nr:hypothetical protein [SAR324 cluster bacterium]
MNFNPDDIQPFTLKEFPPILEDQEDEDSPSAEKADEGGEENVDEGKGFTALAFRSGTSFDDPGEMVLGAEITPDLEDEKIALAENFRNTEFTEEKSQLTNAEEYAKKIREGAEIYSQRMHDEVDAKHKEVQQILESAEAVKEEAKAESKRLIEDAKAQVQAIKDEAYKDGFSAGEESGTQQRYDELAPQVQQIDEILEQLSRLRQIVRFQGEQDLLQLAILIAKKVVYEELAVNPDVIYNIARTSLQEIEALGKIRILVHPDDYDFLVNSKAKLEKYIKDEQTLVIVTNIDAEPGELLIETDESIVDFHFKKQFEAIEEVLNRTLHERQTHLHDVDMDAHDFTPPSSSNGSNPPTEA